MRRGTRLAFVVFLAPALVIYTMFAIYPIVDSLRLSFYTVEQGQLVFTGLSNFVYLLTDSFAAPRLWNAFVNNLQFFLIHLLVQNPIGLLLAALLTSNTLRRAEGVYRTLIFIPTTLSVVIVGFVWQLILSPLWGIVDTPLLGQTSTALPTLSLMSVWQYVGIPMVFLYAVLVNIPAELMEAGRVDGANAWQVFWRVKFPLLAPMFGIISIVTYIANFNAFDLIYAVQGASAGPNFSTDIFGTLFYRTFLGTGTATGSITLGATVASVMFMTILVGVGLYLLFVHRRLRSYQLSS